MGVLYDVDYRGLIYLKTMGVLYDVDYGGLV